MSRGSTSVWLYVLVSAILGACTLPYDFEIQDTGKAWVIDASLTNEQKAHVVKLSYSLDLDEGEEVPVKGALVRIAAMGKWRTLSEVLPGQYITDSTYAGIPGNFYQLSVELPDGTQYLSSEEELLPSVPIDSIYARYIQVPHELNATDSDGVQVFLDTHSDLEDHHNFRYELRESYAVVVPFPSR